MQISKLTILRGKRKPLGFVPGPDGNWYSKCGSWWYRIAEVKAVPVAVFSLYRRQGSLEATTKFWSLVKPDGLKIELEFEEETQA